MLAGYGEEERGVYPIFSCRRQSKFRAYAGAEPIATLRLVREGVLGLPAEEHFDFSGYREAIARKRVRHLGYRTPLEMTALFSQALALGFPSLFEGFGLPVVDAFYAGCPVLSSDRAALPEVGGEAALYASPTDRTAWASGMARLAADPELRRACIAAGHARREQFTWRKTALQTIQLYEQVFHGLYE